MPTALIFFVEYPLKFPFSPAILIGGTGYLYYRSSKAGLYTKLGMVSFIILFFIFCFRVVGVGQVGIITKFGMIDRSVGSGVLLELPWPI